MIYFSIFEFLKALDSGSDFLFNVPECEGTIPRIINYNLNCTILAILLLKTIKQFDRICFHFVLRELVGGNFRDGLIKIHGRGSLLDTRLMWNLFVLLNNFPRFLERTRLRVIVVILQGSFSRFWTRCRLSGHLILFW